MNKIWAPWRSKYVKLKKKQKGCIFCLSNKTKLVVKKSKYAFVLLNKFPYNNGHAMVCPKRHVKDLKALSDRELLDIIKLVRDTQCLLERKLKPHGFNIGINSGRISGAGIEDHIHIHIVPRWSGDTNFMPVIGNTKVVPQSLKELHKLLTA